MSTRRAFCLLSVLAIAYSLAVSLRAPVAFEKVAALTDAPLPTFAPANAVDIVPLIRAIPDRGPEGSSEMVYEVLPAQRYQRSVVEGIGNCSNLVKGLAYYLIAHDYQFEVVHLMPIEGFLDGEGHTVLRAKLALPEGERVGLADLSSAAIPRSRERVLDLADFDAGDPGDFHLDPIRPESEDRAGPLYAAAFQHEATIGRTTSADQAFFYRFLEATYLDFGLPPRLERILYSGVGVVLGIYPTIHVADLGALRSRHSARFAALETALWSFRIAPLVLFGCALSWLVDRRARPRRPSL